MRCASTHGTGRRSVFLVLVFRNGGLFRRAICQIVVDDLGSLYAKGATDFTELCPPCLGPSPVSFACSGFNSSSLEFASIDPWASKVARYRGVQECSAGTQRNKPCF